MVDDLDVKQEAAEKAVRRTTLLPMKYTYVTDFFLFCFFVFFNVYTAVSFTNTKLTLSIFRLKIIPWTDN